MKNDDGTDRLSQNVGKNYHYSLRDSPEERSSQIYSLFKSEPTHLM